MTILVLAEHDNHSIRLATRNALGAAAKLGGEVHLLVSGNNAGDAAQAASKIPGVAKVLVATTPDLDHALAESTAALIAGIGKNYSHILAASTASGRNILPRVAALLDVQQVSDILSIESPDTFTRPIYAGNAISTVQSTDAIKVITVRMTAFDAVAEDGGSATIETVPFASGGNTANFLGQEISKSERPELTAARVVVSGGRGMQSGENFQLLERIADPLNAALGASRAAVDAGFVPNEYQVGQTGKIVAPDLYIAVGISGAIQHLAGMKDSKVIVAINKDGDAPIFQVADYGLVGDLFTILPELAEQISKLKAV